MENNNESNMKYDQERKVPYEKKNMRRCICAKCPVQGNSQCVKEKLPNLQEALTSEDMPEPKDIPGFYCSGGDSTCKRELDFNPMCICANCENWNEYDLAEGMPAGYFCRDGKARE